MALPDDEAPRPLRWSRELRRSFGQLALGLIALVVLGVVSYRLMLAPIHGVRHASDCARAYAKARTYGEKLSADNLSFRDTAHPGVDMRCAMVRTGVVSQMSR